jgi:hypothetical protein
MVAGEIMCTTDAEQIMVPFLKEAEELSKGVGKGGLDDIAVLCVNFQKVVRAVSNLSLSDYDFRLLFNTAGAHIRLLTFHYGVDYQENLCIVQKALLPLLANIESAVKSEKDDVCYVHEDGRIESKIRLNVKNGFVDVVLKTRVSAAHLEKQGCIDLTRPTEFTIDLTF